MHDRFPIFTALDQEWQRFSCSCQARAALQRWRTVEPALAGLDTVEDVLALRRDRHRADEVLGALVSRSARDQAAARVVLQALMPGLVRLAVAFGKADPDTADELVAIAWQRICSYPTHRIGSVAANLLFDIRKQLVTDREPIHDLPARNVVAASAEDEAIARLLVEELANAEATGVIAEGAAELIMKTRVEGHPVVELAARRGVTAHGLVQRRRRAESRLRDHLDVA